MVRPVPALTVIAVLLLAGCGGLVPSTTPTQPVTPAPSPPTHPPGVTADGVQNASALMSAHESILATNSYTMNKTVTRRYANGTLDWRYTASNRVAPTENRHHTRITFEGTGHTFGALQNIRKMETYRTDGDGYGIETNATTTRSFRFADRVGEAAPLLVIFSTTEMRVQEHTSHNGTKLYRLTTTRITEPTLFADAIVRRRYDTVENVRFTAVIDSRGFIHEYTLSYTYHHGVTTRDVSRDVRYRADDRIAVTEPPWYEDAKANATER